ncbi:4Fe-4S binding protein [Halioxenophilus sp. WMMB6]|uniref:4Fe-4S binding protein n=1 Tax=Halioxenophilus sp. WMMB6 TaxID=3073815 RepID=UPI00295E431A|nr:4Fe-4S binding protein [Halioxenophilus sp. WMMB6]
MSLEAIEPDVANFFPSATRVESGYNELPIWVVYQLNEVIGYLFTSNDFVDLKGFSGERINLLIGMDTKGTVTGLRVLHHHEPIFLHGLGPQPLIDFVGQYKNHNLSERIIIGQPKSGQGKVDGNTYFDGITKATVSVMVINDTIISSAREVARHVIGEFAQATSVLVRQDLYQPLSWPELMASGLVQPWQVSRAAVEEKLRAPLSSFADPVADSDQASTTLYLIYLNPPMIGRNFLGEADYQRLMSKLEPGEHAVAVMSEGFYDYLGEEFRPGTLPDRIALTQHDLPIALRDLNFFHMSAPALVADAPQLDNLRLFRIRSQAGFNPAEPFQLSLTISLTKNFLQSQAVEFNHTQQLPANLFETIAAPQKSWRDQPWVKLWLGRVWDIALLLAGLALLTVIFTRQQAIIKPDKNFSWIRHGFLAFTLIFIGFHAQGQLSVVNIYPLLLALKNNMDLSVYLLDPIILILWLYVLASLILWGRGLFCGWLCPFGVLQEWLALAADKLNIRQLRISAQLHQRLRWLKYFILAGLIGTALISITAAEKMAEVEPFKTAITLGFIREWPFVIYALVLLGMGLFVHKFYCRYLCPLGAFLALAGKLHHFEWLQRRLECGSPCQLCRHRCGIQAIDKQGKIDYDECIQCLECVVILEDNNQCAPLKVAGKRQAAAGEPVAIKLITS